MKKDAWYAGEIAKAYQSGIIKGDSNGNIKPEAIISRQEAAVILTRAFSLTEEYAGDALTGTNSGAALTSTNSGASLNGTNSGTSPANENIAAALKYADHKQIADWALDSVGVMTKKDYVSGRPGNLFAPKDDLSRSEAVKMIDNVMGELINSTGTYTKTVNGNMVVSSQGVTLKDTNIDGDLYLTDGIGQDTTRLIGVTVKGRTIISGTLSGKVIVLSGSFGEIVIECPDAVVTLESGAVDRFVAGKAAAGVVIIAKEGTVIENLITFAGADITGGGNIKNAVIASGGVTMDVKPQNVIIEDGGKAVSYNPNSGNTGNPGGGGPSGGGSSKPKPDSNDEDSGDGAPGDGDPGGGDPGGGDPGDGDPGDGDPGDGDPGDGDPGDGDPGDGDDDDPEPDTTAPSVPTGLNGTAVSSSVINLSWAASTDNAGVTGYCIYRDGKRTGTSSATSYNDTGLTAGTSYSYAVSAYDAAGNESYKSSSMSIKTKTNNDHATYTLSVVSKYADISLVPEKVAYSHGEQVKVTAVPHAGYAFGHWYGELFPIVGWNLTPLILMPYRLLMLLAIPAQRRAM